MNELYLISVLGNIRDAVAGITVFASFALVVLFLYVLYASLEDSSGKVVEAAKAWMKRCFIILSIAITFLLLVPDKRDMWIIYGGGSVIEYIRNDSVAQKIPHNALEALNIYLEKEK